MLQQRDPNPSHDAEGTARSAKCSKTEEIDDLLLREERLMLVINELGHRSKNLLAVVLAIANQTAKSSSDLRTFQGAFSQRIDALSRSLDLLMDQGERGVRLADLVRRQLAPFSGIDGASLAVSGPDLLLSEVATMNLGLALHELATNAIKYGALSVPDGTISVHWDVGKSVPVRFRLIWSEENGPTVAQGVRRGFGSAVLQRLTATELGGNIQHEFHVCGVRWVLDAPAETIVARDVRTAA
jgi:two-component sensor histidine kinase